MVWSFSLSFRTQTTSGESVVLAGCRSYSRRSFLSVWVILQVTGDKSRALLKIYYLHSCDVSTSVHKEVYVGQLNKLCLPERKHSVELLRGDVLCTRSSVGQLWLWCHTSYVHNLLSYLRRTQGHFELHCAQTDVCTVKLRCSTEVRIMLLHTCTCSHTAALVLLLH